jgi:nickel-dependent lactate racemase
LQNKMKIQIPYGLKEIEVDLPELLKISIVYSNKVSLKRKELVVKETLENPFGCASFVKWGEKILFIINDAARPTPAYDILSELCKEVNIESNGRLLPFILGGVFVP